MKAKRNGSKIVKTGSPLCVGGERATKSPDLRLLIDWITAWRRAA